VTSAELTPEEKDAVSHRGKALRKIAPVVAEALRGVTTG
jgi:XTP/dITP diphosphohydrolase